MVGRREKDVQAVVVNVFPEYSVFEARTRDFGLISLSSELFGPPLFLSPGSWIKVDIQETGGQNENPKKPAWKAMNVEKIPDRLRFDVFSFSRPGGSGKAPAAKCAQVKEVPAIVTSFNNKLRSGFAYSEELGRVSILKDVTEGFIVKDFEVGNFVRVSAKEIWGHKRYEVRDFYWVASAIRMDDTGLSPANFPSVKTCRSERVKKIGRDGFGFFEVPAVRDGVFFTVNELMEYDGNLSGTVAKMNRVGDVWELMCVPTHYSRPVRWRAVAFRPVGNADNGILEQVDGAQKYLTKVEEHKGPEEYMTKIQADFSYDSGMTGSTMKTDTSTYNTGTTELESKQLAGSSGTLSGSWESEKTSDLSDISPRPRPMIFPISRRLSLGGDLVDDILRLGVNDKSVQTEPTEAKIIILNLLADFEIYEKIAQKRPEVLMELMKSLRSS